MREETPNQRKARLGVRAAVANRGWKDPDLAREAGINIDTARGFLNGTKWSNREIRAKIEEAIGWDPDTIQTIAEGHAEVPPTSFRPAEATDYPGVYRTIPKRRERPETARFRQWIDTMQAQLDEMRRQLDEPDEDARDAPR